MSKSKGRRARRLRRIRGWVGLLCVPATLLSAAEVRAQAGMQRVPALTSQIFGLAQPAPFLRRYGVVVVGGLVILVFAVVIVVLQHRRLKRQAASLEMLRRAHRELEEAHGALEAQVVARTQDLEARSQQLRAAAVVAREAAAIRDAQVLIETVASIISQSFGFDHTGIFLVDGTGGYAVLRAASSPVGQRMAARGHRLRVAQEGIVGHVAGTGEARIASMADDSAQPGVEERHATRSEMALPLRVQDHIIGVLDVQSEQPDAFGQADMEVLSLVADQLALAIHHARLFAESRRVIEQLQSAHSDQMAARWQHVAARAYRYDGFEVRRVIEEAAPDVSADIADDGDRLKVPLVLRDQLVGTITLERSPDESPWTDEERAMVESIGVQAGLSLEAARLLQESQARARRERTLGDIAGRMRETLDMDLVVQTALREMGQSLGLSNIEIRLGDDGA